MFVLVFGMVEIISGIAFLFMKTNVVINTGIIENLLNNYGIPLLVGVIILMYFISYKISCKIFYKKDF